MNNQLKRKKPAQFEQAFGDPYEIRTRVTAVKGRCLRPLDQRAIPVMFCLSAQHLDYYSRVFVACQ